MERVEVSASPDFFARAADLGHDLAAEGPIQWQAGVTYRLSEADAEALGEAAAEIEKLALAAAERVVAEELYDALGLPEGAGALIGESWRRGDRNLYGRMDFAYRPGAPPKLLEYNADTPTVLVEAATLQALWLETTAPAGAKNQINWIDQALVEAWRGLDPGGLVHFTALRDQAEDQMTLAYLRDTAGRAGLATESLFLDEIGWNGADFLDLNDRPIRHLFKLYPWEWLLAEEFGAHFGRTDLRLIEPAWKLPLSAKSILPLLWDMAPDHPNLLPAALDEGEAEPPYVRKPVFGRAGADITIIGPKGVTIAATEGGDEGARHVVQAYAPTFETGGTSAIVGVWMVASRPVGIGIREQAGPIVGAEAKFVPHFVA
ncbi:MAG: glutathionylspermidine synthase family protein [Alphaproteobacteria bacterium]|nr:glutathionylspermidine synthase family protein [Alphaproteobacteria bacterium]